MAGRASIFGILGCALLAGILGMWREAQTHTVLTPDEVNFGEINSLDYDATTGVFRVTGIDPFGYLELPAHTIPLLELRLEFAEPSQPGGWYVYPCPAHLRPARIDQAWVVTAVPETLSDGGHALVWTLEQSQLARIDFPDELAVPLTLQRVVLRAEYASSRSPIYLGMLAAWTVTLGLLLANVLAGRWRHPASQGAIMLGLVALKLGLAAHVGQSFMPVMVHDDGLFLRQAQDLLAGNWLGAFDELTLAKGPSYAFFLMLSALSGLSIQTNAVLLHALGCLVLTLALWPWLRGPAWRLGLFAVLLFDPHSMSAELIGRVLRSGIHPALTLFTFAGLLGLVVRARGAVWKLVPWAVLAGVAGVLFWYSREEGIWGAPSALLLLGTATLYGWSAQAGRRVVWLLILITLPMALFEGGKAALRTINQQHYGVPIVVDVLEGNFPVAYGAISRVTNPDPIPGVPTTRATRGLIYTASPSLARLREHFETHMVPKWAPSGWWHYEHPRAGEEIRNGWFAWALRESAAHNGIYTDAANAEAYWQTVAGEINAAVENGALSGGRARSGFFPRWDSAYTGPVLTNWLRAFDLVARSTDFSPSALPSQGDPQEIARLAELFHAELAGPETTGSRQAQLRLLAHQPYAWLGWPLTALALLATAVVAWRSRQADIEARVALGVLLSLWGGVSALTLVCALVETTAFPALIGSYLGPAAPLLMACWVLAPALAWSRPTFSQT